MISGFGIISDYVSLEFSCGKKKKVFLFLSKSRKKCTYNEFAVEANAFNARI